MSLKYLISRDVFDSVIFRDIRTTDPWIADGWIRPIRIDCRLLPNKLRKIYSMYEFDKRSVRQIAKKFNLQKATVLRRLEDAQDIMWDRLKLWLNSLGPSSRNKETKKRWVENPLLKDWEEIKDQRSDWVTEYDRNKQLQAAR